MHSSSRNDGIECGVEEREGLKMRMNELEIKKENVFCRQSEREWSVTREKVRNAREGVRRREYSEWRFTLDREKILGKISTREFTLAHHSRWWGKWIKKCMKHILLCDEKFKFCSTSNSWELSEREMNLCKLMFDEIWNNRCRVRLKKYLKIYIKIYIIRMRKLSRIISNSKTKVSRLFLAPQLN